MSSQQPGDERYRDFYKFMATVDGAAVVGALALRRDLGLDPFFVGIALLMFGISAYMCIFSMLVLTQNPHVWEFKRNYGFAVGVGLLTALGTVTLILGSLAAR